VCAGLYPPELRGRAARPSGPDKAAAGAGLAQRLPADTRTTATWPRAVRRDQRLMRCSSTWGCRNSGPTSAGSLGSSPRAAGCATTGSPARRTLTARFRPISFSTAMSSLERRAPRGRHVVSTIQWGGRGVRHLDSLRETTRSSFGRGSPISRRARTRPYPRLARAVRGCGGCKRRPWR